MDPFWWNSLFLLSVHFNSVNSGKWFPGKKKKRKKRKSPGLYSSWPFHSVFSQGDALRVPIGFPPCAQSRKAENVLHNFGLLPPPYHHPSLPTRHPFTPPLMKEGVWQRGELYKEKRRKKEEKKEEEKKEKTLQLSSLLLKITGSLVKWTVRENQWCITKTLHLIKLASSTFSASVHNHFIHCDIICLMRYFTILLNLGDKSRGAFL